MEQHRTMQAWSDKTSASGHRFAGEQRDPHGFNM
jgi:hypothetical protein